MFIKTQSGTILNFDRLICCDVVECREIATIKAKINDLDFEIYQGTFEDAHEAFHTIEEGLIKGASLIDFSKEN